MKDSNQKQLHAKYSMHALMRALKDNREDDPLSKQEALDKTEELLKQENRLQEVDYTENQSGQIRWAISLSYNFISLAKVGLAHRKNGQWWITEQGRSYIEETPTPDSLFNFVREAYQKWANDRESSAQPIPTEDLESIENLDNLYDAPSVLEDARLNAKKGIENRIGKMDPYDFQNIVAAIIESTGWHVQYIASRGESDKGVDIVATRDTLGAQQPRLCVQVKHYCNSGRKVTSEDVSKLRGSIVQQTSTGMVVTSSGFTRDARENARGQSPNIELVDLDKLLDILERHYNNLSDKGKSLLPLVPVYFISPDN